MEGKTDEKREERREKREERRKKKEEKRQKRETNAKEWIRLIDCKALHSTTQ